MVSVLFVCVENSCRSQMAEGFASNFGKGLLIAYSAGSKPAKEVNPYAVEVMRESGIDLVNVKPKSFQQLLVEKFDYVITLGCKDSCPFVSAKQYQDWLIEDPKGRTKDVFRKVRDTIKEKVKNFIKDLRLSAVNNKEENDEKAF